MCLCLRKQQSRLLCSCYDVSAGPSGTLGYFLDSRFRGTDTSDPTSLRSARLSTAGGKANCSIRLI